MDFDLLVRVPWTEHGWYSRVWGDRILAFTVSSSAQLVLHVVPGARILESHVLTRFIRVKVISITIFFVVAIVISSGGIGGQKIGFKYWHDRRDSTDHRLIDNDTKLTVPQLAPSQMVSTV